MKTHNQKDKYKVGAFVLLVTNVNEKTNTVQVANRQ